MRGIDLSEIDGQSVPIFSSIPAGTQVTVRDHTGAILIQYITTVNIPAGSSVTITRPQGT